MTTKLQEIISRAGGVTKFGEAVGVTKQAAHKWLLTRVPAERCWQVVKAMNELGIEVTPEDLRPDVFCEPTENKESFNQRQ